MVRYIKLIFPAVLIISVIAVLLAAFPGFADKNQKERFYVGEAACRSCHHNTGLRDQHNSWYLSKHARGYASLALPESKEIARLSGIDVNPFLSPICLKCHTTASDTEAWRRDETFLLEDGVQCEHCHGPGSDYMDQEIMADRDASREAGLIMPEKKSCLVCHKPKGSHQAVLKVKTFEYESAVKEIGHPGRVNPATWDTRAKAVSPSPGRYIGATACGRCHKGEDKGYIFSKWRLSPHADAYAVLGTPKAFDVAKKQEVKGNPQKSPTCLKCHATVYPNRAEGGADMMLGVQCESCHGPGIDYAKESIMADPAAAKKAGLIRPTAKTCKGCHKEKNFNFQAMKQKVCFFPKRQSNKQTTGQSVYKTPSNLAVSHDSKRLFIVCESSDTLIVFDTVKRKIVAEITVGNQPHGVCF
ncbi:MAG: hypothetical protein GY765_40560, partial [bacterium]|nr:hypothetical protein [bacterium]